MIRYDKTRQDQIRSDKTKARQDKIHRSIEEHQRMEGESWSIISRQSAHTCKTFGWDSGHTGRQGRRGAPADSQVSRLQKKTTVSAPCPF